jgi:hypothetical protein
MVTSVTLTYLNPLLSKAEWWRYCNHLRVLKLCHFKLGEAMGLKIMTSRSPSMASLYTTYNGTPYVSSKVITGHADRQAGDFTSLFFSIFGK